MTPQIAPEAIPHMNMFEDTKAWLSHVAAVEAGLSLRRRQTALQRQWLDAQGWAGEDD
jgi:hypothetical protein